MYKARAAKVAVPDSTAEEGEDEQRAACSATHMPAPTASFAAGSRFIISFSDSDDDALASRSAGSAHQQTPPGSDYEGSHSSWGAWSEQFDSDNDASDNTTVNSASYDEQCASAYTTTKGALLTEPDSSNSSDTQSDRRYDVDETCHEGPSDTYSAPTGPIPDWSPDTYAQACSQYWQGVFAASLSTCYIGNWPGRDTNGTDSSAQEGVPATDGTDSSAQEVAPATDVLVREICCQAAADDEVDEFVRSIWGDRLPSWAGSVRWTARLPFGASLAATPFVFCHGISNSASTPRIPPCRAAPVAGQLSDAPCVPCVPDSPLF